MEDASVLIICRCEEVTAVAIDGAIAAGARDLDDIKRATRAGMGFCQGTFCHAVLRRRIAERRKCDPAAIGPSSARSPARPILIDAIADLRDQ